MVLLLGFALIAGAGTALSPCVLPVLPALLSGEFEASQVELVPWQGSGDVAATARANCYIVIPQDRDRIPAGEFVEILSR